METVQRGGEDYHRRLDKVSGKEDSNQRPGLQGNMRMATKDLF